MEYNNTKDEKMKSKDNKCRFTNAYWCFILSASCIYMYASDEPQYQLHQQCDCETFRNYTQWISIRQMVFSIFFLLQKNTFKYDKILPKYPRAGPHFMLL